MSNETFTVGSKGETLATFTEYRDAESYAYRTATRGRVMWIRDQYGETIRNVFGR
jgi:hypothetical protein